MLTLNSCALFLSLELFLTAHKKLVLAVTDALFSRKVLSIIQRLVKINNLIEIDNKT